MKHTPGPWSVCDGDFVYALTDDGKKSVNRFSAGIDGGHLRYDGECTPREEIEANARLIAAAPELFELLKQARAYVNSFAVFDADQRARDVLKDIDAAIAKAEGRS